MTMHANFRRALSREYRLRMTVNNEGQYMGKDES